MLGCLGSHRVPRIQIRLTFTRVLLLSAIRFKSSCMDVICYLAIHQHPSADTLRAAHFSPLQKALFRQQKAPRWSPCAWSCHTQRGSNAHSAPLDQMERGSGVLFSSMDWSKLIKWIFQFAGLRSLVARREQKHTEDEYKIVLGPLAQLWCSFRSARAPCISAGVFGS